MDSLHPDAEALLRRSISDEMLSTDAGIEGMETAFRMDMAQGGSPRALLVAGFAVFLWWKRFSLRKALSILVEVRAIDRPDLQTPRVRELLFKAEMQLRMAHLVGRVNLDELCDRIEGDLPMPSPVLHWMRGDLAWMRGQWSVARSCYLRADQPDYSDDHTHVMPYLALLCALKERRPGLAAELVDICRKGAKTCNCGGATSDHHAAEAHLALYHGHAAKAMRLAQRMSSDNINRIRVEVWAGLSRASLGDPASHDHPARKAIRTRPAKLITIEARWKWRVLVLDYRLACLVFALGGRWRDLEYQKSPFRPLDLSPPSPDRAETLGRELARAGRLMSRVRRIAASLDAYVQGERFKGELASRIKVFGAVQGAITRRGE